MEPDLEESQELFVRLATVQWFIDHETEPGECVIKSVFEADGTKSVRFVDDHWTTVEIGFTGIRAELEPACWDSRLDCLEWD